MLQRLLIEPSLICELCAQIACKCYVGYNMLLGRGFRSVFIPTSGVTCCWAEELTPGSHGYIRGHLCSRSPNVGLGGPSLRPRTPPASPPAGLASAGPARLGVRGGAHPRSPAGRAWLRPAPLGSGFGGGEGLWGPGRPVNCPTGSGRRPPKFYPPGVFFQPTFREGPEGPDKFRRRVCPQVRPQRLLSKQPLGRGRGWLEGTGRG